ncbi:MAG: MBL fold metallo-hydrolase [Promethearchaeota archaeon]|nr:MAG: MBL fold metallo-hydrolase [Candidatus Lokiarchaeota archaeon]
MKEVHPGIYLIKETGSFKSVKPTVNVYVLAGDDGLIFDAGYGDKITRNFIIDEIEKIRKQYNATNKEFNLTRVLPSHAHPDHVSGLDILRKHLGVKIILTKKTAKTMQSKKNYLKSFKPTLSDYYLRDDKAWSRIKHAINYYMWWRRYKKAYGLKFISDPDEIIDDDSEISINHQIWKIISSPGHSSDHVSLYNEHEGILFSGDNIIKNVTTYLGPNDSNLEDYVDTIKNIQNLPNLKLILPAHGMVIKKPKKRIQEILNHRRERFADVVNLIKKNNKNGITPSEIIKEIYPNSGKTMDQVARGWICLTLNKLETQGGVIPKKGKNEIRFFPTNKL